MAARKTTEAKPAEDATTETTPTTETSTTEAAPTEAPASEAPVDGSETAPEGDAPDPAQGLAPAADGDDTAVTITADDTIDESAYELADQGDQWVTLNRDIVEEFYFPDTKRPSHRLLFTKGQVVRKADIDALNARVEARRAVAGGDGEPDIDSNTRAYQQGA